DIKRLCALVGSRRPGYAPTVPRVRVRSWSSLETIEALAEPHELINKSGSCQHAFAARVALADTTARYRVAANMGHVTCERNGSSPGPGHKARPSASIVDGNWLPL